MKVEVICIEIYVGNAISVSFLFKSNVLYFRWILLKNVMIDKYCFIFIQPEEISQVIAKQFLFSVKQQLAEFGTNCKTQLMQMSHIKARYIDAFSDHSFSYHCV